MEAKHIFTDLKAAYEFYYRAGAKGQAATLHTVVPCKQWCVTVKI
jgi:hypothetical protein